MNAAEKLEEKGIVLITQYFNTWVGSNPKDYEDQHEGYSYGKWNKEGERILEICAAINIAVRNTLFKKMLSLQVTNESG